MSYNARIIEVRKQSGENERALSDRQLITTLATYDERKQKNRFPISFFARDKKKRKRARCIRRFLLNC